MYLAFPRSDQSCLDFCGINSAQLCVYDQLHRGYKSPFSLERILASRGKFYLRIYLLSTSYGTFDCRDSPRQMHTAKGNRPAMARRRFQYVTSHQSRVHRLTGLLQLTVWVMGLTSISTIDTKHDRQEPDGSACRFFAKSYCSMVLAETKPTRHTAPPLYRLSGSHLTKSRDPYSSRGTIISVNYASPPCSFTSVTVALLLAVLRHVRRPALGHLAIL